MCFMCRADVNPNLRLLPAVCLCEITSYRCLKLPASSPQKVPPSYILPPLVLRSCLAWGETMAIIKPTLEVESRGFGFITFSSPCAVSPPSSSRSSWTAATAQLPPMNLSPPDRWGLFIAFDQILTPPSACLRRLGGLFQTLLLSNIK